MPAWQHRAAHAHASGAVRAVLRRAAGRLGLQLGGGLSGRACSACCRCPTSCPPTRRWPRRSSRCTARWPLPWPALVLLHVAAALKHQFIDRDGLLGRMRPGRPEAATWPSKTVTRRDRRPGRSPAARSPRRRWRAAARAAGAERDRLHEPADGRAGAGTLPQRSTRRSTFDPKQPDAAQHRLHDRPGQRLARHRRDRGRGAPSPTGSTPAGSRRPASSRAA